MPQDRPPLAPGLRVSGNNTLKSLAIYQERVRYRDEVFPAIGPEKFYNFWGADRFVGRVSLEGNTVLPRERQLKALRYADESLFAVNFVADAWRDFAEKIRELTRREVLYADGAYHNMTAKNAWESSEDNYHAYMVDSVYPIFANVFMRSYQNRKRLVDINSFFDVFTGFCKGIVNTGGPVTRSGFLESIYSSPMNSGLAIEISEADHADDFKKVNDFLTDKNFEMVSRIASYYGFVIDKNAPWRFVADVSSAAMQEYMVGVFMFSPYIDFRNGFGVCREPIINDRNPEEPYGFSTIPGITHIVRHAEGYEEYLELIQNQTITGAYHILFTTAYVSSWQTDMDLLKLYLVDFYNRYATDNPQLVEYNYKYRDLSRSLCAEERLDVTEREQVDPSIVDPEIGAFRDRWNLKSFYVLRLLERGIEKSSHARNRDLIDIYNLYNLAPGTPDGRYVSALKYIQKEIIGPLDRSHLTIDRVGDIKKK
jgi:hypothetical protein